MKISLCCIAGNAERYIDRFLDSFQPHFDEVVIVRACGNQDPDRTLGIALDRGCRVGEYRNAKDWPHVDDFAAARNASFDLATGDWVMWADMDDLLENGEVIRKTLEDAPDDCDVIAAPYDVRDDQLRIMRERIIRKGACRWLNPIHEELRFPDKTKTGETRDFQLVHMPLGKRGANDERNVRILESIAEPTGSQRFHLAQSLRAVGRIDDAIQVAGEMLMNPPDDLGKVERFELFLFLAQLNPDPEARAKLCLQALATEPARREGYGELALCYLARGEFQAAESWARAMEAQPMPGRAPWNLRQKFYGYAGKEILASTLRAQNRPEEADAIQANHAIRHGAKIALLHATRGRPQQAAATRRKWLETASNPDAIDHIFGLDQDDETAIQLGIYRHVVLDGKGGPVAAWNACAVRSVGQVLIQLSDDWEPFLHWDQAILDAMGDTGAAKVLAVSDGHRKDDLLCMAILTRARLKEQGCLFHPEFFSMYSDNWFSECAFRDGVVIDARDSITFQHLHPAFGKGEMDETYQRTNHEDHYKAGEETFHRLRESSRAEAVEAG